jgi:archaellum component FlaC
MKELRAIRKEIKELRMLYKNLAEKVIPLEEPTSDDRRAIKRKERIIKEEKLMRALD